MKVLNLPTVQFRVKNVGEKKQIFDVIRRKYVALTPEEWVRQHFIHYLIQHKKYSRNLLAIEMPVLINGLKQRADIVAYNRQGKPVVIIECKAPSVAVSKTVFNQAARYNMQLQVKYLIVTNGMQHYCAQLSNQGDSYEMLSDFPSFDIVNA